VNNIIEVFELHKSFGTISAIDGISFAIGKGEMFGLVGPDGAGKTTTIRTLCGLLTPDAGSVSLFGMDIRKEKRAIQKRIGYLSQKFSLYGDLSVDENIEFFADIHGVANYRQRRDMLLDFTRLTPFRDRYAEKLSGGMKQKLALACSLIHTPDILFLDEPTTGVDPVSRRDFWKILSDLLRQGITIFMTTPYLDEAERCTRVALMHQGKLLSIGEPKALKENAGFRIVEVATTSLRSTRDKLAAIFPYPMQLFGDRLDIVFPGTEADEALIAAQLKKNGIVFTSVRVLTPSLENVFINSVQKTDVVIHE
jgi:ABC-2 type transport system ATP-binding protein